MSWNTVWKNDMQFSPSKGFKIIIDFWRIYAFSKEHHIPLLTDCSTMSWEHLDFFRIHFDRGLICWILIEYVWLGYVKGNNCYNSDICALKVMSARLIGMLSLGKCNSQNCFIWWWVTRQTIRNIKRFFKVFRKTCAF